MSRKQLLVGIHGLAYNGKSSVAKTLADRLDLMKFTIAEPVTEACARILMIPHHDFLQLDKERRITGMRFTPRQLMQAIGRSLRDCQEDFLLKELENRMSPRHGMHDLLFGGSLITDIRLPIEAQWLRDRGGVLVHIIRDGAPTTHNDITEQTLEIQPGDVVIKNSTTLEELETKVKHLAQDLHETTKAA